MLKKMEYGLLRLLAVLRKRTPSLVLFMNYLEKLVEKEIPGLKALNAVDELGVHPLLLAIGSERYTPYNPTKKPQELLTISNRILGTGQVSLAKFLFICDEENSPNINNEEEYFTHFLKGRLEKRFTLSYKNND